MKVLPGFLERLPPQKVCRTSVFVVFAQFSPVRRRCYWVFTAPVCGGFPFYPTWSSLLSIWACFFLFFSSSSSFPQCRFVSDVPHSSQKETERLSDPLAIVIIVGVIIWPPLSHRRLCLTLRVGSAHPIDFFVVVIDEAISCFCLHRRTSRPAGCLSFRIFFSSRVEEEYRELFGTKKVRFHFGPDSSSNFIGGTGRCRKTLANFHQREVIWKEFCAVFLLVERRMLLDVETEAREKKTNKIETGTQRWLSWLLLWLLEPGMTITVVNIRPTSTSPAHPNGSPHRAALVFLFLLHQPGTIGRYHRRPTRVINKEIIRHPKKRERRRATDLLPPSRQAVINKLGLWNPPE